MRTCFHSILAAALVVAVWQPTGVFGRDRDASQGGTQQGGGGHRFSGDHHGMPQAAPAQVQMPAGAQFSGRAAGHSPTSYLSSAHGSGAAVRGGGGTFQPSDVSHFRSGTAGTGHHRNWGTTGAHIAPPGGISRGTGTHTWGRSGQTYYGDRHFNGSNNYGGRWFPANKYPHWNRGYDHYYGGNCYRWNNGGWLIINSGFWPYGYPYYGYDYGYYPGTLYQSSYVSDYYDATSVAVNVQSALADLGYYRGPIDGIIGPMTRQAIADYQRDRGLVASGRINRALLGSLGLR